MNKFLRLATPFLIIAGIIAAYCYLFEKVIVKQDLPVATEQPQANKVEAAEQRGALIIYGFYAGMPKADFDAAIIAMRNNHGPIVKWARVLSDDEKTVPVFVLIFPTSKFFQVAKDFANQNGKLECQKTDTILCEMKSANGDDMLIENLSIRDKQGNTYGSIIMADKDHQDPKSIKKENKHEGGDVEAKKDSVSCPKPTRLLNGNCVSDL